MTVLGFRLGRIRKNQGTQALCYQKLDILRD